jgi:hypothetical protein
MTEAAKLRWNTVPMWALLLAIVGLLTNVAFFVSVPLQSALPWVSLTLAVVALIVMVTGVRRAIVQSQVYRGKVLSIVLAVVTLTVAGLNIFGFFGARALPGAAAAPQVGQQAPDFTVVDSIGLPTSLDSLFVPAPGAPASDAPKAVLLIFYRGYW